MGVNHKNERSFDTMKSEKIMKTASELLGMMDSIEREEATEILVTVLLRVYQCGVDCGKNGEGVSK